MPDDDESGFTLVELMVVIVIIGLLATIVIVNVLPVRDKAMTEKARADIALIEQGLELYRLDNNNYPAGDQGLRALLPATADANHRAYLKRLPDDPWGNPYLYAMPGQHGAFDVWTQGADGAPGGEGSNADIGNWH